MKNQFSNRNQSNSSFAGALMLAVLISVAFFAFDTLTGGLVRSYVRTVVSLAWASVASSIATIDESGVLKTRRALEQENQALKDQLALRSEQSLRFHALESENEMLRILTHLVETEGGGQAARVLSSFSSSPYGTFLIGAGKNDGIQAGDVVLTPGGFVLGVITDLDMHTATVESLFAPGKKTDFVVNDIGFTAEGRGGGNTKAEVPRDAVIAAGDAVTVPAFGGRAAGVVGSIQSASSSATQTLFVRIPVNLSTLSFVYVIPHR